MTNTTKTMETIQRVKKITEDIILDKELPEKMGPRFFPLIQDQLHQIINVLNSLESKITLLHFASQFPQALFLNKNGQIFSREQMLNKVNETNQTLNNITAVLQHHFTNNSSQTPEIIHTLSDPHKTHSDTL